MSVIRDAKAFDKGLLSFGKSYKQNRQDAHDYAVSSLYHTAAHRQLDQRGRTDKLHRFYDVLRPADQEAFRQWAFAAITIRETDVTGKTVVKRWLTGLKNGAGVFEFRVVEGTKALSDAFSAGIDNIDTGRAFFDHEPAKGERDLPVFGETELLKAIQGLLKKAETANEKKTISDTMLSMVESAKMQIENAYKKEHEGKPLGQSRLIRDGNDVTETAGAETVKEPEEVDA